MTASARRAPLSSFNNGRMLAIMAGVLYFAARAPYLGQWDSFDYLKQIVTHRLSDLGFGRPFFIGYNIVLWETTRKIFGLGPLQVERVVPLGILLLGSLGVLLFYELARRFAPPRAAVIAALGFMLSPLYALYSGYVMTEAPMLAVLLAAALSLWNADQDGQPWRDIAGGLLFGMAFGIREQSLTLAGAFLWILWTRRPDPRARLRSLLRFALASLAAGLGPVVWLYLQDPVAFFQRIDTWLGAIPRGPAHFWKNVQATILYTLLACPAAGLSTLGAGVYRLARTRDFRTDASGWRVPAPLWGFLCCLALPLMALWRDADVQIHPRYALIVLPAAATFCATLYDRWTASARAAVIWGLVHVLVFGLAQIAVQPFRQLQFEKKQFTLLVRENVRGEGLLIAGGYSPIFDYYRALGERPRWRILWSGWGWSKERASDAISEAWERGEPVYLCDGPSAWLMFEDERLDLHYLLTNHRKEPVAPGLFRILP
jgi:4-amino-4-deoxy-L-arabinose transferase-like glycosyltransferase